jgi:DNA-binding transcriptional regulator of glucitol operon
MIMGGRQWQSRLLVVALTVMLAGCATNYENLTADERLLREQSDSFVAENVFGGAATGAIIGGVLGALVGAAVGGDAESAGYGAAAGAGAGLIVGGIDGYLQGKAAQYQANQVMMARAVAADVRKDNQRLSELLETASRVVEADKRKLEQLKAQVEARQITLDQASEEAEVIRENSETIEDTLADAREKRDNYLDARHRLSFGDTAELDMEIHRLNAEIAELERQVASLNASLDLTGLEG